MEDTQLSFEALAKETMEMSQSQRVQDFSFTDETSELIDIGEIEEAPAPEGPGLIYKIEKGISTFCVRGIACQDIKEIFDELTDGEKSHAKKLKLETEEDIASIKFYSTESAELAEQISEELINRRFPIEEDILCNLSDPGFSWWLDVGEDHFQVFFKSHGIHRAEDYIRLGPLGDRTIACSRMLKAEAIFRSAFPVGEFVSSDKGFAISTTDPTNIHFQTLKNFFLTGENNTTDSTFPPSIEGRTLFYYFKEVASIRHFWLTIEKEVTE
jgi:hypothetical protein